MSRKDPLGATPLTVEDREGLIPEHITTREELNALEFANINEVYLKYLAGKPSATKAPFTVEWLRKVHREMFGQIWKWAGQFRRRDLNVGVQVHHIASELKKFESDLKVWERHKHGVLEIAAKIHHRLVWIHPFRNGNGRWARLASNIYLKREDERLTSWPEKELFIGGGFRKKYIQALQKADQGDIAGLMKLHRQYGEAK